MWFVFKVFLELKDDGLTWNVIVVELDADDVRFQSGRCETDAKFSTAVGIDEIWNVFFVVVMTTRDLDLKVASSSSARVDCEKHVRANENKIKQQGRFFYGKWIPLDDMGLNFWVKPNIQTRRYLQ